MQQPSFRGSGDGAHSAPQSTPESRRVSLSSSSAISAGNTPQRHSLASPHSQPFNPLIFGNDVDSVDVATRVAMVSGHVTYFEHHRRVQHVTASLVAQLTLVVIQPAYVKFCG